MKSLRLFSLLFAGLFLFILPRPLYLVKILKGPPGLEDILQAEQLDVLQELETCYLARADRGELGVLRKQGIRFSVLDRDSEQKVYVLVPLLTSKQAEILAERGHIQKVEEAVFLFWTETGDPLALLPPELKRKPLPRETIVPYLRTYPSPEGLSLRVPFNEVIPAIISEVDATNLRAYVQSLQDFGTRYASTSQCEAAGQFLLNYFQTMGFEARFEPFAFGAGYSSRNVIAELKGETDPEDIVILCAHYDSTSNERLTIAPGADDNASGTAAVMEAARILSRYRLDFTIRFIAFSAEEWGLLGSRAHAAQARLSSERIIGVINLDMIAFADRMPEDLDIVVNKPSEWMAERAGLAAAAYTGLDVRKSVNASFVYSDHSPFWDNGYPALCGIEDEVIRNPYYHTTGDTVDTLNFIFFERAARTALAVLSDISQPVRPGYPKTPRGLASASSTYSSPFTAIKNVLLTWQPVIGAVGYNVYRSTFSHLGYRKVNSAPLTATDYIDRAVKADVSYYYVVTAIGPGDRESNYSREVEVRAERPRYKQTELGCLNFTFFWATR